MTDAKKCPQCGTELPADAPAGICPKCLLAAGLAGDTGIREERSDDAPTTPLPHSSRFVPPHPQELARVFPQLEILELIGAGGMGAVYKARQPGLDRVVAVKILPPEVGADPSFAQRFMREAQALARLGHQHIVSVYDFGVAGGLYYFIMEYVDGANLRHLIKTRGLKAAEALAIVPQICEALQFAHDEGVVHRDIKPENILLDKRGRVKIADFGLARLLGSAAPEVSLTGTNQVLGTLHYMAPEQIQGLRTVDHRADIYSLGVVFYEMLTGELPLGRFAPPSQKVEVDVRLDEVVLRSLESEPQRRYQQVSQVKTEVDRISLDSSPAQIDRQLDNAISGRPTAADSAVATTPAERLIQKLANALLVVGGFGLASIIVLAIWLTFGGVEKLFPVLDAHSGERRGSSIIYMTLVLSGLYSLVAVPHALIMIVAALLLRNRKAYWLAVAACVLAALPITFAFPIGLPIGLWGLAVLTSQDVRAVFARVANADLKTPSERLFWPAIGLLVAAIIDGGQSLFLIGVAASSYLTQDANRAAEPFMFGVVALAPGVLRLVGGIRMLKLESRALCTFASVTSLLPVSFGSFIGIPAGIWALFELARSDVKEAFARTNHREDDANPGMVGAHSEPLPYAQAPASAADAEERQRAEELAERPPGWLAFVEMGVSGLGWLFAGAMWNLGTPGWCIATVVLASITYLFIRWNLVYSPKLRNELRRQSPRRRGLALLAGLAVFVLAMIFVTTAQTAHWDLFGNPGSFGVSFKDAQDQLLTAIKAAKFGDANDKTLNLVEFGPTTWRSPWEPLMFVFFGFWFIVCAVATVMDTRRFRNSWKYGWNPALKISLLLVLMLVMLETYFMPKGAGRVPPREVRSAATKEQLQEAIEAWGAQNGYRVNFQSKGMRSESGTRPLPLVPVEGLKPDDLGTGINGPGEVSVSKDGKQYIVKDGKVFKQAAEQFRDKLEAVGYRLSRPSAFDLYRMSWGGVYRPRPPLTITCLTKTSTRSERVDRIVGPETTTNDAFMQIETPWEWLHTPESELWPPILDDLKAKIAAVAEAKVETEKDGTLKK